jgi:hypothetical protein
LACRHATAIAKAEQHASLEAIGKATRLMISADGGGSNGYRVRLCTLLGGMAACGSGQQCR